MTPDRRVNVVEGSGTNRRRMNPTALALESLASVECNDAAYVSR